VSPSPSSPPLLFFCFFISLLQRNPPTRQPSRDVRAARDHIAVPTLFPHFSSFSPSHPASEEEAGSKSSSPSFFFPSRRFPFAPFTREDHDLAAFPFSSFASFHLSFPRLRGAGLANRSGGRRARTAFFLLFLFLFSPSAFFFLSSAGKVRRGKGGGRRPPSPFSSPLPRSQNAGGRKCRERKGQAPPSSSFTLSYFSLSRI